MCGVVIVFRRVVAALLLFAACVTSPGVLAQNLCTAGNFVDAGGFLAEVKVVASVYGTSIVSGPVLINNYNFCDGLGSHWRIVLANGQIHWTKKNLPYYVATLFDDPSDFDEDGCFDAYGEKVCPGDPHWRDEEGYDLDGFDKDGKDRGGKTAAEGGGYSGSAGTGGTSPQLSSASPSDPQNGDNTNEYGILVCAGAYPGYTIDTSPALLNYSAPGLICSNSCQYGHTGSAFDFSSGYAYNNYAPTGSPCNGEEANISINIGTHTDTPPPAQPEYNCYLQGSIWECYGPGSYNFPDVCYFNNSGAYGAEVQCPQDVSSEAGVLCGHVNGYYTCFDPDDGCRFFKGQLLCFASGSTTPIPSGSPDHPQNGGNADGNPNNDVFEDEDDVAENGYTRPQQQLNSIDHQRLAGAIDSVLANEFAALTSNQAQQNMALNDIRDLLEGGMEFDVGEYAMPDGAGAFEAAADAQDALIGEIVSGERTFDGSVADGLSDALGDFLPTGGTCATFVWDLLPAYGLIITLDTCDLELARYLAEWVLSGMTLMLCISLVLRSPGQVES